jgi:hypothetical protein
VRGKRYFVTRRIQALADFWTDRFNNTNLRAFSVPIESERRLCFFFLTRPMTPGGIYDARPAAAFRSTQLTKEFDTGSLRNDRGRLGGPELP